MKDLSPYVIRSGIPSQPENSGAAPGGPSFEVSESVDLRDIWRIIRKHRLVIILFFLGVTLTTGVLVLTMAPTYTAMVTLLIERNDPHVVDIKQVLSEPQAQDENDYYKTQYEILKSRNVAAQVIREQKLENNQLFTGEGEPGVVSTLLTEVKSRVRQWIAASPKVETATAFGVPAKLIDRYLNDMLAVEPVTGTRLAKISFTSPDPALSARIANAHAETYVRQGLKIKSEANREARQFLEQQLVELKNRVENSEADLNAYRKEKGIIALDDKENVVVERFAELNKRLTEAEVERIALEAQVWLIKRRDYDSLPAVIGNSLVATLKAQLTTLQGEYANLSAQFKAGYPKLAQVKANMEEVQIRLQQEIRKIVAGIESVYFAARTKEKELRAKTEQQKIATLEFKDASVKYAILAREAETNRQLYDSVLGRIKEIVVTSAIPASNVFVIDSAYPPVSPSRPKILQSLLLSGLVGLLGGMGLAFLREYMDKTLKTPKDAERYLSLPNLGLVPEFLNPNRRLLERAPIIGRLAEKRRGNEVAEPEIAFYPSYACEKPDFSFPKLNGASEAYRTLRTGIMLSQGDEPPKTVLFTSAVHAEGKTATVVNSAMTFAQMGVKVLLIDADLHRPSCHKILGMRRGPGLAELLDGRIKPTWAIQPTHVDNLFFMSSGSATSNPTELFSSKKMRETLLLLSQLYDYVLIDSPPVMAVSDGVLLSTMTDGVVLVVGGQQTPRDIVKQACSRLHYARAKILGLVLNRIDPRKDGYSHYYDPYKPYANAEPDGDLNTHVS